MPKLKFLWRVIKIFEMSLKLYNIETAKMNNLTLRKSRSHITSGLGSPTTSQDIMTVSPSIASVDSGFVTKRGSLEYLQIFIKSKYNSSRLCKCKMIFISDGLSWRTYGMSGIGAIVTVGTPSTNVSSSCVPIMDTLVEVSAQPTSFVAVQQ